MRDTVLQKYKIAYYHCPICDCIFTEPPYWLQEAYHASITVTDTGIMERNINACKDLMHVFKRYFHPSIKVVDYGGGYGILTRMLRDRGVNAFWSDKYSENLLARGFEYDGTSLVDVMLAFEVVEHLSDPLQIIGEIMKKANYFIFSVNLLKHCHYKSNKEWWYFAAESGQHIFFPSAKTLQYIALQYGCTYYNLFSLHIFARQPAAKLKSVMGEGEIQPPTKRIRFSRVKSISIFLRHGLLYVLKKKYLSKTCFCSKIWEDHLYMKSQLNM
jgi:hypothetical protein